MSKYLPFYSKGDDGIPALAHDTACVLYLPLWKKDGPAFKSDDMYGHNCTKFGAIWNPFGMSFDGADDYINIPDSASLDTIRSFEAWINPVEEVADAAVFHLIFTKYSNYYVGLSIRYNTSPNQFTVHWADSVPAYSHVYGPSIPAYNIWYHVVGILNSSMRAELFVNGLSRGVGDAIADNNAALFLSSPVRLGGGVAGRYSKVNIGEVRAYSRVLTAQEVSELYLSTRWRYQ